eukprot:TRINITY_DN43790_c0_g1_i1.p1 TRINITY_DN43790_c0_g1~~TRINITY_DN43790_c0_g1_i1.p1  ORF type:complete len:231 (+),score=99.61 TRINITY_DN43790_c0_g1_i1:78-770(+)
MADASSQVRKQVEQMKQFILSEADERAQEIIDKARSEAEARKQEDLKRGKTIVEADFKKSVEELRTQQRVRQAKAKKGLDDSVLAKRVEATTSIREAAFAGLQRMTSDKRQYSKLLQQLTVQAAFVLEGPAKVQMRAADQDLVDLPAAAREAEKLLTRNGRSRSITLRLDEEKLPADRYGGVFLTLEGGDVTTGGITCDNTLSSRLGTCLEEYAPVLRHELFLERKVHAA